MQRSGSSSSFIKNHPDARNYHLLSTSVPAATLASLKNDYYSSENFEARLAKLAVMNKQAEARAEQIQTMMKERSFETLPYVMFRKPPETASPTKRDLKMKLAVAIATKTFIKQQHFTGKKKGYTFNAKGEYGSGYYKDAPKPTAAEIAAEEAAAAKAAAAANAPPKKQLTHEEKFQQEKELKGLMAMAEEGMNSRFTDMFKAFQYVDLDRSGRLSKKEIQRALDLWNIPINDEQLDLILGHIDEDEDGISYEEFVDKLARGTVSNAAMGKRGMQSKEAMGVDAQEMLAKQLGHGDKKYFNPSINA